MPGAHASGGLGVPRLVVAGVASGVGKTTVMVALAAAFRARGLRLALFKCGPDYLDPTYHARASGRACHNLDGWMMGREGVRRTFAGATAGADLALIEGMMGLYDGVSPTADEGSTAEIAKWLEAPVLLCADASAVARSLAALARGFVDFDPAVRVAGLLPNRVGGRAHLELLRRAVSHPPIVGGLPAVAALAFPERHLGLRTAADPHALPDDRLAAWGRLAEDWLDLAQILTIARAAPPLLAAPPEPAIGPAGERRCRLGIARDAAFHFYYEDNLRRLEALGAELVPFSPIGDAALPAVDGLYLGGGYPEAAADALAENRPLRQAVRDFARRGGPIYAECGGLMFLCDALVTLDGRRHPMVGLLPGEARMHERLQALGYVEVETTAPSLLGPAGLRFRGHQFRYSTLEGGPPGNVYALRSAAGGPLSPDGHALGSLLASYVHAHFASCPRAAEGLVDACAAFRARGAPVA